MTVEHLLRKRYKVIADWLNSEYVIGDIFLQFEGYNHFRVIDKNGEADTARFGLPEEKLTKYPHLFQPLPWYSYRDIKDMPLYLRHGKNGHPKKVKQYHMAIEQVEFEGGRTRRLNDKWLPITEEEYLQFKNNS